MKKILTTIALCSIGNAFAQLPNGYEVATWRGFAQSAVTYSLDDLTPNQLPVALPIFDKYNIKASFNVITSWVSAEQWSQLRKASNYGHEIASHTITHKNFAELSETEARNEIANSRSKIIDKTGSECITLVYPYCVEGFDDIMKQNYISARGCSGQIEKTTPDNMMNITSKGVGGDNGLKTATEFNNWVEEGKKKGGWSIFLIHGIDNDGGYAPIKSSELESHIKYVAGHPNNYWVETFANISKYIIERNNLSIKEVTNGNKTTIYVTCNAKSNITQFNFPVTIKHTLPNGKHKVKITCNETKNKISIKGQNFVIFDVIPGNTYNIKY